VHPGGPDLDDAAALRAADVTGALLHAAMGGGQVRGVATAVAGGALDALRGGRPRAVVWVTGRSARARQAAGVVAALAAAWGGHPVPPLVVGRSLPPWAGALDVVLVSGDDAGDPELAAALSAAARRGADVVTDLPAEGPVRDAADTHTLWLPPLPYLPPYRGTLHHVAAGMAVLSALGAGGLDVAAAADAVDAELEGLGPELATPVNPAKLLAHSAGGSDPLVWVHADPVAEAVAARAVAALADAGRVTASTPLADELRASAERTAAGATGGDPLERLFHDDEIDGTWTGTVVRHLGMVCHADAEAVRAVAEPLGDVEWVTGGGRDAAGSVPAGSGEVVALMSRIELAAAYLLVGGL